MTHRRSTDRYLTAAERAAREVEGQIAMQQDRLRMEERNLAEAPRRTACAKPALLATLDALEVTVGNVRGALLAARVFDVRAVGDHLRFALSELDRTEERIVAESGLEVQEG